MTDDITYIPKEMTEDERAAVSYWQDRLAKFFPTSKGPTSSEVDMFISGRKGMVPASEVERLKTQITQLEEQLGWPKPRQEWFSSKLMHERIAEAVKAERDLMRIVAREVWATNGTLSHETFVELCRHINYDPSDGRILNQPKDEAK